MLILSHLQPVCKKSALPAIDKLIFTYTNMEKFVNSEKCQIYPVLPSPVIYFWLTRQSHYVSVKPSAVCPPRLVSTINKFISMLKTMTFYLLFMLDQVTFNHLAYIVMVLFGIIYNFWNVPNLTFIKLNSRQFCHLTSAVDWTFPVKIKHSAVHFWRCRMFPADRNRKWHWSIALC